MTVGDIIWAAFTGTMGSLTILIWLKVWGVL